MRDGEILNADLADELVLVRRILGYSQSKMAKTLGITKNSISIYETKSSAISLLTALKVHFVLMKLLSNPEEHALRKVQVNALGDSMLFFENHLYTKIKI